MEKLVGNEAIAYLESLKAYEFKRAQKRPIGKRVLYYKVQTDWINEMLEDLKKKSA